MIMKRGLLVGLVVLGLMWLGGVVFQRAARGEESPYQFSNYLIDQTTAIGNPTPVPIASPTDITAYELKAVIGCKLAGAALTKVVLTVSYTDISGTVQTPTATAACNALGSLSKANINEIILVQGGTNVTYSTAVTASPTYVVNIKLKLFS